LYNKENLRVTHMDIIEANSEQVEEVLEDMDLFAEHKVIIVGIFEWVKRMTGKYGSIVKTIEGTELDWGQALCREQFGTDWEQYMLQNNITMPTKADLEKAIEWEEGNIPDWVNQS